MIHQTECFDATPTSLTSVPSQNWFSLDIALDVTAPSQFISRSHDTQYTSKGSLSSQHTTMRNPGPIQRLPRTGPSPPLMGMQCDTTIHFQSIISTFFWHDHRPVTQESPWIGWSRLQTSPKRQFYFRDNSTFETRFEKETWPFRDSTQGLIDCAPPHQSSLANPMVQET